MLDRTKKRRESEVKVATQKFYKNLTVYVQTAKGSKDDVLKGLEGEVIQELFALTRVLGPTLKIADFDPSFWSSKSLEAMLNIITVIQTKSRGPGYLSSIDDFKTDLTIFCSDIYDAAKDPKSALAYPSISKILEPIRNILLGVSSVLAMGAGVCVAKGVEMNPYGILLIGIVGGAAALSAVTHAKLVEHNDKLVKSIITELGNKVDAVKKGFINTMGDLSAMESIDPGVIKDGLKGSDRGKKSMDL